MNENTYFLILTIIQRGFTDTIMETAHNAGAKGGTILSARGTGALYAEKFLGGVIEPEKEMLLILANKDDRDNIMKAIYDVAGLHKKGQGLVFALPVDEVLSSFSTPKN